MDLLETTANAETLTAQVANMVAAGRLGVARPLLAALRRMGPPSAQLTELSARLAMRENRPADALNELDQAIAIEPEQPRLRIVRAQLRVDLGDLPGAAQDAAEAVVLDRTDPTAKALLGMLMLELGHVQEARACLAEAVGASPDNPSFREGLAAAEEASGQSGAAAATLAAGIAACPGRVELRSAAILLQVRLRNFAAAVDLAESARQAGAADACVFGLKGHALSSLGRHEEAGDTYREALKLGPNDPDVRHLVAANGFLPPTQRAPKEYLSTIFDGYAPRFESHLIELGYRIPGLIRAAVVDRLEQPNRPPIGPVLDLGCGTGLLALVLADLPAGPFTGVDLSARMLAQAQSKGLYARLHRSDLMEFLAEDTTSWNLILAADVLCYFGALDEILSAVWLRLAPGGQFLFSAESAPVGGDSQAGAGWSLQRQGRYTHTAGYIAQAAEAAGFRIRSLRPEVQRFEADEPVHGFFVALERPSHDG
jgi:predicted TPR repeat methyltransferase